MPIEKPEDAKTLIGNWMSHRKISGSENDPIPSGVLFQFTVRDETGIPITIIQPIAWKTTLIILSEVSLSDRIKSLESMRPKDRDEFLFNLQKDITFAPAQFAFDPTFEKTGIPKGIQFSREICYDGLTEDKLNGTVRDIARCVLFVIWQVRKEFGKSEKG